MKISSEKKKLLLDEIRFVLGKMKEQEDPKTKLYYFTAIYGIMHRIFNLEFAPDLIFIHFVLKSTFEQINLKLHDPEKVVGIPDGLFDKLVEATAELLNVIEDNKNPYEVLKRFAVLGYATGGNGYYLYEKGLLKL